METSLPWGGTTTGDATLAPYNDDEWSDVWKTWLEPDTTIHGVIRGYGNEYTANDIVSPVSIGTGYAMVDGKWHKSDAAVDFVIANPTVNPRIDRIVLRKTWATQLVRLTLISGAEAAAPTLPAITQNDGSVWDITLWAVYIDVAGNITLIDERNFIPYKENANNNVIINGNMSIWQAGQTWALFPSGASLVDMFGYGKAGTMVHTVSQSTDVPTIGESGVKAPYSLKYECTTIDAAIAAGDYVLTTYKVEGFDYAPLKDQTVTLSFWIKAVKPGVYCVSFINNGSDRSYVAEYTINSASTWEKKSITLDLDQAGGTENYANGVGLKVFFCIASGATFQTTANSWQNGNYFATANQVNGVDNVANDIYMSLVKLELGTGSTQFISRPFEIEVGLCQRYYEKSYNLTVAPGTATAVGSIQWVAGGAITNFYDMQAKLIPKRTTPTITWYSTVTGTAARIRDISSGADKTVSSTSNPGENITGSPIVTVASTDDFVFQGHFTADSRL